MDTSWRDLKFHPLANHFPLMEREEFKAFAASIGPEGPENPNIIYEGMVLDGRNRLRVCLERDIEPKIEEYDGRGGSPLQFVINQNLNRRHLSASQRAMLALKLKGELAKEAKANMSRGGQGLAALPKVHSRDQSAQLAGVSSRLVGAAERVKKQGAPALIAAVERGEIKLTTAEALLGLGAKEQEALAAQGREAIRARVEQLRQARVEGRVPEPDLLDQAVAADEPAGVPQGRKARRERVGRPRQARAPASKSDPDVVDLAVEALPEPGAHEAVAVLKAGSADQRQWLEGLPLRAAISNPARFDQAALFWWIQQAALNELGVSRDGSSVRLFVAKFSPRDSDPMDLAMLSEPPDRWKICLYCKGRQTGPDGKPCWNCLGDGFCVTTFDPCTALDIPTPQGAEGPNADVAMEAEF
jgi:hypothetical protein